MIAFRCHELTAVQRESVVSEWVKSLGRVQLCDPMDCSPPGSSVHGILQKKVLEWVAISFSKSESRSVVSDSLQPHGLHNPWDAPGQNTGEGSLSLLQGIFQPGDRTQVSRTAGRFFTS